MDQILNQVKRDLQLLPNSIEGKKARRRVVAAFLKVARMATEAQYEAGRYARAAAIAQANSGEDPEGYKWGTIKWFSIERGYGFIIPADGSPDVYLHGVNVDGPLEDLRERVPVVYLSKPGDKGPCAERVHVIK